MKEITIPQLRAWLEDEIQSLCREAELYERPENDKEHRRWAKLTLEVLHLRRVANAIDKGELPGPRETPLAKSAL